MATKRAAPSDEPSTRQSWKRHKPDYAQKPNFGKKSFQKAHPTNALKSKVRDLSRLLQRELPADVRVEKERALQTATQELKKAERAKRKSEVISRWHKVRFFDRQRSERRLKRARRELKEDEENAELQRNVEECELDLNYALFAPLEWEYVPLYPTKRKKDGDDEVATPELAAKEAERQGDDAMRERVRNCMRDGTLKDLREGRLDETAQEEERPTYSIPKPKKTIKQNGKQSKEGATNQNQQVEADHEDDESGGGFFE